MAPDPKKPTPPVPVVGPKGVTVNLPSTGTFTPPPPHAPQEVSQPLGPELIAQMQAKAEANEKELGPLKYALSKAVASAAAAEAHGIAPPGSSGTAGAKGVVTAPPHAAPDAPAGSAQPLHAPAGSAHLQNAPGTTIATDPGSQAVSPSALPALPPDATPEEIADPVVNARPARGQPKPILDQGKTITGGWGPEAGGFAPQYYALDGTEIQALVATLFKEVALEMAKDLRFGIACVYPQALVRITVEIAGAHPGAAINDVAFSVGSRIAVYATHKMDDQETPADALRMDAGIPVPFKHTVKTPTGTFIVDKEG